MNNKAPTTNTLSYFDAFSKEWVTIITIRHAAEKPVENNVSTFLPQDEKSIKTKLEEAVNCINKNTLYNSTLPKVSPNSFWNK